VYVGDLGMPTKFVADLGQHLLFVVEARSNESFLRQVVFDVAIDQVLNGRRRPARALVAGGVETLIDLLA